MKKTHILIIAATVLLSSCKTGTRTNEGRVITVSIPPFEYFVKAVADTDFIVNVMLPQGADHHSWEPLPAQITALAGSEAFLINGQLGFEHAWMDRFREVNKEMLIVDLSMKINLIEASGEEHEGHSHGEEASDPHYWMSPREAVVIAASVKEVVTRLNPGGAERYDANFKELEDRLEVVDSVMKAVTASLPSRKFMIFHPALGYIARDYNLEQVSFEDEGKEPSPARMKELIDRARSEGIKLIFIQAEYDAKSARVLAGETGTELITINPMNPDWESAVIEIAEALGTRK